MEEHTQTEEANCLKQLKQEIQQLADEAKSLNAWIHHQTAILNVKKEEYKQITRRVKDLIKQEHLANRRAPLFAPDLGVPRCRSNMQSRLYGHGASDVSHRAFANDL